MTEGQGWRIRSVPPASTVLIHQLLSLIISWVQDTQQDSGDHLHGQLLKGPLFARIFGVLFSNAAVLSSALMSQTVVLLSDIINNDPAPPGMLGHMLSSGIADLALRSCLDPLLLYSSDLLMAVSSLASACCLMQEGIDMVIRINPFNHLFSLLLDEKYYYPYSKVFMTEVPNNFGSRYDTDVTLCCVSIHFFDIKYAALCLYCAALFYCFSLFCSYALTGKRVMLQNAIHLKTLSNRISIFPHRLFLSVPLSFSPNFTPSSLTLTPPLLPSFPS